MDDNLTLRDGIGLCATCRHVVAVRSDRGSIFYQCQRGLSDPGYPRYPMLPVLRCRGYKAREPKLEESTRKPV